MRLDGEAAWIAQNKSNVAMEAAYQFQWSVEGKQWYVSLSNTRPELSGAARSASTFLAFSEDQADQQVFRFYLFFSSGRCCNAPDKLPPPGDEYKIMVCRSSSPTGPFVDDLDKPCLESGGKMVLGSHDDVYGPGGQGILYDEQLGMPVMYYHYMNHSTGYRVENVYFGWNRLSFESGWPVVVTEEEATVAAAGGKGGGSGKHGTHHNGAAVQRQRAAIVYIGLMVLTGMVVL